MMDYNSANNGLVCMVCGCSIPTLKLSTIKMHIQQKHPDTTYLSDQEKAVIMEEWAHRMAEDNSSSSMTNADTVPATKNDKEMCVEISDDLGEQLPKSKELPPSGELPSSEHDTKKNTKRLTLAQIVPKVVEQPAAEACNTTSFKNQQRYYQVRWRTEYMMDYDCGRKGLICMVCGGTLATLKVSTIKRHIVQVHPYSVEFSPEERQRIVDAYSEMAVQYIHSGECFKQSQLEPGQPHHPHPACGSVGNTRLTTDPDDVIVI